jgi:serine/threonine protein kinase/Tfp pilus assembly protein PilF
MQYAKGVMNMIGKTISQYKILQKLGEGGMGVVYKADDTKLKRTVALKFLPPGLSKDKTDKARFLLEARAAAALNHNNVCTIYEIQDEGDNPFIAMEYVEGRTFRNIIGQTGRSPLRIEDAIQYAAQIAEALKAAHGKGIVHRDIKSENIMVSESGQIKVMDFGLAKLRGSAGLTKTASTLGTVAYMSPEQIQAREADHRSDLWSLGVLFYEMLSGQRPFRGDYEAAVIYEILNAEPMSVRRLRQDVPDRIDVLISKLLQKDPNQRIQSAGEVLKHLEGAPERTGHEEGKKSIAVLYFENMSSDKENEYFCAGMTEDLIIDLSKIKGLKVIPRSDVLPFRKREIHSREVGMTLGVRYILEGSVRKGGNRIRITSQLIDVKSGFQVWAERYDRLVEDIFDIQIEVSEKIAEALQVSLTESEKQSLAKKPTDDLRAHDFYMRGTDLLLRKGSKNVEAAIQMFEHAIAIDDKFSLAYIGLVEAYSLQHMLYGGDRSYLDEMMRMNKKALTIDPDLIEAQFGIGLVLMAQKKHKEAVNSLKKVIQRKKDFYPAYYYLGVIADILEDYETAVEAFEAAARIKPYSEEPVSLLRETYMRKGDTEKAKAASERTLEIGLRKLDVNPDEPIVLSRIAATYAYLGKKQKALSTAKKVVEIDPDEGISIFNCAGVFAYLGYREDAIALLGKALDRGFQIFTGWVQKDPYLESIRDDPKFKNITKKYQT